MQFYTGWDVGGAHLKMAEVDASGCVQFAGQWPTPLWQGTGTLVTAIARACQHVPDQAARRINAITMTGELADGFENRREGVAAITRCFETVLHAGSLRFYAGPEGFLDSSKCATRYTAVASANWYATTSYVATLFVRGILFDLGSTTADIVPFENGRVLARGYSDHERLLQRELSYSGVVRTPVMAVVDHIPWGNGQCPVMNENFANLADVYRITGELPESADMGNTCDAAARDIPCSIRRLARMIGIDAGAIHPHEIHTWQKIAVWISRQQQRSLGASLRNVMQGHGWSSGDNPEVTIIGAGCGRFLVRKIADELQLPYVDLETILDTAPEHKEIAASCATAVSVAQLMRMNT